MLVEELAGELAEEPAGELAEELSGCFAEDTGRSYGLGHCTDSKHDPGLFEVGGFGLRVGIGFPVVGSHFGNRG